MYFISVFLAPEWNTLQEKKTYFIDYSVSNSKTQIVVYSQ